MPQPNSIDEYYISRCLALAEQGRGHVSPNPLVGCVVLDAKGHKIAEGYHPYHGGPHAEVMALDLAGEKARGGTLYVNLEPCNHTGKTPPCTEKIIAAGIEKVVCGTLDPNPLVSGSGRDRLQNARITVRHGFLETDCRRLNEHFFHAITTGRPFVTLKLAMTVDGKIASRQGASQNHGEWLTGDLSRQYVHYLRANHDAVLTTANTVLADNPRLTARNLGPAARQPKRIVLDRRFRLSPDDFAIFDTDPAETWVVTSRIRHNGRHAKAADLRGVRIIEVDDTGLGLNLNEVMVALGEAGIASVMVEAGGQLAGALMRHNLVNKLYLFYAPQVLSDAMAHAAFCGSTALGLEGSPRLSIHSTRQLENDLLVEAYPLEPNPPKLLTTSR